MSQNEVLNIPNEVGILNIRVRDFMTQLNVVINTLMTANDELKQKLAEKDPPKAVSEVKK
jgi:hypothetical protein